MSATNAADSAIAQLEAIDITSLNGNTADRLKVLHAARKLVSSLETPIERVRLLTFQNSLQFAAVETCTKLGLWRAWASQGGGKKTVQELRQLAPKIEESLLRKYLGAIKTEVCYILITFSRPFVGISSLGLHHNRGGCGCFPTYRIVTCTRR